MSEEKKPEAEWKHDQKLAFTGLRTSLEFIKSKLELVLAEKKAEFARMSQARDSIDPKGK
jgi:hypothetical protein